MDIWEVAEGKLAPAEHLGARLQLNVNLEADDRLVLDLFAHAVSFPRRAGPPSKPSACSSAKAQSSSRFSLKAGPPSWNPTGRPSLRPQGMEIAGMPASDIGTVQKSFRYIASGSFDFAPSSNAVLGAVGVTMKSTAEKAVRKSSEMRVRTRCAVP